MVPRFAVPFLALILPLALVPACDRPTGSLTVEVVTGALAQAAPPQDYEVRVEGQEDQTVPATGTVSLADVSAGLRSVSLGGLSEGCAVAGSHPRTVEVPPQGTATTRFVVRCQASPGDAVVAISFDWSTEIAAAPGSDNWPLTWCEDGHQYTSWGDGGGFGGSNDEGRVSLGFGRVEGDHPDFTGFNLWGGVDAAGPARLDGKVESMLCVQGVLYALRSPGSDASGFDYKEVVRSTDKGRTWGTLSGSRLQGDAVGAPGLPFYVQYGQDYGANDDGFVYIFTIRIDDPDDWEVQVPGITWLARAPAADEAFVLPESWEWVTGFDDGGEPVWGPQNQRVPVVEDPDGYMRGSAIHVPHLDRFLMVQNHTARNEGNIVIYEAPAPWGPWTQVLKEQGWPDGSPAARQFAFGNFSPKWLDADGRCVFVWFRPDRWNSVECQLRTD